MAGMASERITFRGFGGVALEAEVHGDPADPAILLVHGLGQTRSVWRELSQWLVQSGRQVIALDLRGHGGSQRPDDGRYDVIAQAADLRAVLAQMSSRPVVVASTIGGWIATVALADDVENLAAGLVLVDMPVSIEAEVSDRILARVRELRGTISGDWDDAVLGQIYDSETSARLLAAAPKLNVPILVVRGELSWMRETPECRLFDGALPDAERETIVGSELAVVSDRTEVFGKVLLDFLERRQPRDSREFRAGSDARTLRDSFGCFATGVTVVTALSDTGQPVGLTVNSFTSVSIDPPLILVCIQNNAGSAGILRDTGHFAINVLQINQREASNRFASRGEDRFAQTAWTSGEFDLPILQGSLVSYACSRHSIHETGDHFILVGKVEHAIFDTRRDPLLYFRGRYRNVHLA